MAAEWLLLLVAPAAAYDVADATFGWQRDALDHAFELDVGSFPASVGSDDAIEDAFVEGLEAWNGAGADLSVAYGGRTPGPLVGNDGWLTVAWDATPRADLAVAVASSWGLAGGRTTDCDIAFFAENLQGPIDWSLDGRAGTADLVETATHEVGHCLGLDHSADPSAAMTPVLRGWRGLTADDEAGAQAIYGVACDDGDGDGWGCDDCDDANARVHPGAVEACDGIDNDCDGVVDALATVEAAFGAATSSSTRWGWGAAYRVTEARVLHRFEQHLDLTVDTRLTYSVLLRDAAGDWVRLHTDTERVEAADGWFASPPIDRPLAVGDELVLAVGIEGGTGAFDHGFFPGSAHGLETLGAVSVDYIPADLTVDTPHPTWVLQQRVVLSDADADGDGLTGLCGDPDDDEPPPPDPEPTPDPEPDPDPEPTPGEDPSDGDSSSSSGCGCSGAVPVWGAGFGLVGLWGVRRRR